MLFLHGHGYAITGLTLIAMLSLLLWTEKVSLSVGSTRTPKYTGEDSAVCLNCHSGEKMHAVAASPHGKLNNPDPSAPSQGCEACHGPGSFHVSRAHGGKGFPQMITFGRGSGVASREDQIGACLSCHEQGSSGAKAISWWGSVHDRKNFNCSSCHLVHIEVDPIKDKDQQDRICFKCHGKQKTGHPKFEDKSINIATLSCWTCHDVHNTMKAKESRESKQQ